MQKVDCKGKKEVFADPTVRNTVALQGLLIISMHCRVLAITLRMKKSANCERKIDFYGHEITHFGFYHVLAYGYIVDIFMIYL
jgi:hypothetical protein